MKAKTSYSFCYCTQNIQQSEAGVHKISIFLLTTSPDNLCAVGCLSNIGFIFCDKLSTCKRTKPREKSMGHTSHRNKKSHHIINLPGEANKSGASRMFGAT